jgi:hypothetical protein
VANAQEGRGAIMAMEKRLDQRRHTLLDQFARAAMAGDDTGTPLEAIQKWNEENPSRVIGGMHLQQAVALRTKRIAQSEQGCICHRRSVRFCRKGASPLSNR